MNVIIADEPIKYKLVIESLITMLYLEYINKDIKSVKKWLVMVKGYKRNWRICLLNI